MEDNLTVNKKLQRYRERQELYGSKRWKECREYMKMKYPLCQDCLKAGKITPMEEVHHIKSPFVKGISEEEKYRRAYDESNLVCLCKECHIKRHHPELTIQEKLKKYED